jgi:hypothetical protein
MRSTASTTLLIIALVALVALVGALVGAADAADGPTVDPISGIFRARELTTPTTAMSCKFAGDLGSFWPDIRVTNLGGGSYLQEPLYPGTEIPICEDPEATCSGFLCTIDGREAECGEDSDGLPVDFGFLGFDAVVTLFAPFNEGDRKHKVWMRDDAYLAWDWSFIECAGPDCDAVADFFGPDFTFPCGDVNSVVRYTLE